MGKDKYYHKEVLIVTDCRFDEKINPRKEVAFFTAQSGTIDDLVQLANKTISSRFKTVLIGGLFWDFFQMAVTRYTTGEDPILLALVDAPNIPELAERVVASSEGWKADHNVNVFWALPYRVDILKFNKNIIEMRSRRPFLLTHAEEMEAYTANDRLQNFIDELVPLIQQSDMNSVVNFVQLDEFVHENEIGLGWNGLHLFNNKSSTVVKALSKFVLSWKCPPTSRKEKRHGLITSQPSQPTSYLETCRLSPEKNRYALRVEEDLFGENKNDTLTEDESRMLLGIANKESLNESAVTSQSRLSTPPSINKSVKRSYAQMVEQRATNCDISAGINGFNTNSDVDTSDVSQLAPCSFQTLQNSSGVESNTSACLYVCQSSISNNFQQGLLAKEDNSCTSPDDVELPRCDYVISCDPPAEGIEVMLCGLGDTSNSVSSSVDRWTQIVGTPPEPLLPCSKLRFSTKVLSKEHKQLSRAEAKMRYYNEVLLSNKRESATQTPIVKRSVWKRRMRRNYSRLMNNVFQALNSD